MPRYGMIEMSQAAYDRLMMFQSLTPALEAEGWRAIETAPKDGTEVDLRVVHVNAAYEDDLAAATEKGWIAICRGHWIDHNTGGFTWHGLCGRICQWRLAS